MATSVINDYKHNKLSNIYSVDFPIVQINEGLRTVELTEILPFRVKFSHVHIESISSNFPAIPFQVIGYSNYIL